MNVVDHKTLPYRDAWALQEKLHADVLGGGQNTILLLEHPPVVTLGRRPGVDRNLCVTPAELDALGVELVQSDRGGDITFHGPGQLVCYPVIRLADAGLGVGDYVHGLEQVVIRMLGRWGINAHTDPAAVGVWCDDGNGGPAAKICALGVRVRRGVSLHGLALNVSTDLQQFNLIIPCGLAGRPVTSLRQALRERCPPMQEVKASLIREMNLWLDGCAARTGGVPI